MGSICNVSIQPSAWSGSAAIVACPTCNMALPSPLPSSALAHYPRNFRVISRRKYAVVKADHRPRSADRCAAQTPHGTVPPYAYHVCTIRQMRWDTRNSGPLYALSSGMHRHQRLQRLQLQFLHRRILLSSLRQGSFLAGELVGEPLDVSVDRLGVRESEVESAFVGVHGEL